MYLLGSGDLFVQYIGHSSVTREKGGGGKRAREERAKGGG